MPRPAIRFLLGLAIFAIPLVSFADEPKLKTENVIFVMLDGLRWQDVYTGAEEDLLNKERGGVANVADTKKQFWREKPEERRQVLLPFLWNTVAKEGQLFGNHQKQSVVSVTNGMCFSYPGYNEILCGFPDPKVNSNAKILNRNVTVLEWLHNKPEFKSKVAAFTSWDVFPFIINTERSGIPVNSGMKPLTGVEQTDEVKLLNRLIVENPFVGETTRHDALTYHAARIYLKQKKPRVLFVSFDETDEHAHAGRYDRVLGSAHKADGLIRDLWETAQGMPEYKGKTTLIISTDHGRGGPPLEWKNHSAKIKGAEFIWAGILGPDTQPLGEREKTDPQTQSQIAATLAASLGFDYCKDVPQAGKPLPGAIGAGK
ncbi:alkaline phosphatase family protein [Zavarzinella formosa]|uniref:alkaline phosphatase family protein n=1 Tax=Zavarzinella formosa TaxID=360055 RepID=UPI00030C0072|nr:alkaline phosphatase family protein [Zavarzinella formosa]